MAGRDMGIGGPRLAEDLLRAREAFGARGPDRVLVGVGDVDGDGIAPGPAAALDVVPAKSSMSSLRTQGPIPRDLSIRQCSRRLSDNVRRWLWVPARLRWPGRRETLPARSISNFKQPPPERVIENRKTRLRILAARSARSYALAMPSKSEEGAGKAGCPQAPAIVRTKCTRVTARCAGTPGLPCAMVLRLIARSPWRRIPLASIADELTIPRSPVGPDKSPSA